MKNSLNDRILAARAAGDWDLHAKLWDERNMAEVDADEAQLVTLDELLAIEPDAEVTMNAPFYHGFCHRFCVRPFIPREGNMVYMVHDADHVTNDDILAGHRSPVVAQFDTVQEAIAWCDAVEEGKIVSVPHESNFIGWPELEHRVTGRSMSSILNRDLRAARDAERKRLRVSLRA